MNYILEIRYHIYAASPRSSIAPSNLSSLFFLNIHALSIMNRAAARTVARSTAVMPENDRGLIRAEPPRMSRIFEMLEPSMFPRASS